MMKKIRLHLVFLLWLMASMSIANTHIHHDAHEHDECVKCYTHNVMSGADAPIAEPISFDLPHFYTIIQPPFVISTERICTFFDARAPPSL